MTFEEAARLEALGHDMATDHVAVPLMQSCTIEHLTDEDGTLVVREVDSETAWISSDLSVKVRQ